MADTNQTLNGNDREPVAFDDRTRRVLELRKLVREGAYHPDAGEVARAMLREFAVLAEITREMPPAVVDTNPNTASFAGRFVLAPSAPAQTQSEAMTA